MLPSHTFHYLFLSNPPSEIMEVTVSLQMKYFFMNEIKGVIDFPEKKGVI